VLLMIARDIGANVTKLIQICKMHIDSKRENPQSPVGLGKGAVYRVPLDSYIRRSFSSTI
jgi:hypothetical protein